MPDSSMLVYLRASQGRMGQTYGGVEGPGAARAAEQGRLNFRVLVMQYAFSCRDVRP